MMRYAVIVVAAVICLAADKASDDKAKLKGKWKAVSVERGGKDDERVKDAELLLIFADDKLTVSFNSQEFEGTYKIDSAKKPKTLDSTFNGEDRLGIYELTGDTLKMCYGEPGEDRPTEFKTKEGSRGVLAVYKREKEKDKEKK